MIILSLWGLAFLFPHALHDTGVLLSSRRDGLTVPTTHCDQHGGSLYLIIVKVVSVCYIFPLYHLLHNFFCYFFFFFILFDILSFIDSFLTILICISLSFLPICSLCSASHCFFFFFLNDPIKKLAKKEQGRRECRKHLRQIVFCFSQVAPESFGCIINRPFIWVKLSSLFVLPSLLSSFQSMFFFDCFLFLDAFCMPGYVLGDGVIKINKHLLALSEFSVQWERVQ